MNFGKIPDTVQYLKSRKVVRKAHTRPPYSNELQNALTHLNKILEDTEY
jgi:hypothetical protein